VLVLIIRVIGGSDLLWRTLILSGELIRCQSDHDDNVYSHDRVAMSDSDGTNSST
jgi:hypothetical protein